jgi:hypothetical protein
MDVVHIHALFDAHDVDILEESPVQEKNDEEPDSSQGGVLPDESLKIDIPSGFAVLCGF